MPGRAVHETLTKDRAQRAWIPVRHGVNCLDQVIDVGSHDEQIAYSSRTRIPERVGGSPRNENGGAGAGLHHIFADLYMQHPFEHIPGFVVVTVPV